MGTSRKISSQILANRSLSGLSDLRRFSHCTLSCPIEASLFQLSLQANQSRRTDSGMHLNRWHKLLVGWHHDQKLKR